MGERVLLRALLAALALALPAVAAADDGLLIIAHRGASAERPEHTLAAYERAIDQGADYIEPDLVVTKDLVLVARHEPNLADTTDVANREEFESRHREKEIDGQRVAGWFAEDFTLEELRTLRARERIPAIRPANARYNGLYQVPTLEEIVTLVRAKEAETGRRIGLYPELKHPTFFLQAEGIDMVDLLLKELRELGFTADDSIFIQSFEPTALGRLNQRSDFKLVQLVKPDGGPVDEEGLRYAEMVTPSGLKEVATFADVVGAHIGLVLTPEGGETGLVAAAKAAGLDVHAWTLREENAFLPQQLRTPDGDRERGCPDILQAALVRAGVAGIIVDDPGDAVDRRDNDAAYCARAWLSMPPAQ